MNKNTAIKVTNLSKVYKLYDKPADRLKEALNPLRKSYHKEFYALDNINFEIKKGETVGIIGKNGAGKSTLLKIITGVLTPSAGHVQVNGRIASLLELGAGFNPEYTGVENIYLQGTLMGYTKEEMESKIEAVLDFADIGDFVYQPVKSYSSGMFARLAFAVAINVEPDILIVDEALSVGDMRFQQKCYRKFREFQEAKKTILFVTHDTSIIINYCTYVAWINNGVKVEEGLPEVVCKKYMSVMSYNEESQKSNITSSYVSDISHDIKWVYTNNFESFGKKQVVIVSAVLVDQNEQAIQILKGGENITLKLKIHSYDEFSNLIVGFIVHDHLGNSIFGSNTCIDNYGDIIFTKDSEYIVDFNFDLPYLGNGEFSISPAIAEGSQDDHIQQFWVHDMLNIKINSELISANSGLLIRNINSIIKVIRND